MLDLNWTDVRNGEATERVLIVTLSDGHDYVLNEEDGLRVEAEALGDATDAAVEAEVWRYLRASAERWAARKASEEKMLEDFRASFDPASGDKDQASD